MNIQKIIEDHIKKFGSLKGLKSKKNSKLLEEMEKLFPNRSMIEQSYLIVNLLNEPPKCIDCDCDVNFISFSKGYQPRCKQCGNLKSSETIRKQRQKPIIEIEIVCKNCNNVFIRKTKNEKELINPKVKFCSKSCATAYNQKHMSNETQAARIKKTKKTNKERYGDEYVVNSKYSRNKTFDKLGVQYALQNNVVLDKTRESLEEKTGYRYPGLNPNTVDKMISTKIKRYGDLLKPCYHYKDYVFPSGRIVKVQGYENRVLDDLLETTNENDIVVGRSEIEKFTGKLFYIGPDNKKHIYYPDIYIISKNLIIEVKSNYTYNLHKSILPYKEKACRNRNFNFQIIIK